MKRTLIILILGIGFSSYFLISSETGTTNEEDVEIVADSILFTTSPVLTPQQALRTFSLAEGFSIELVASEPLVQDPVAMSFDTKGRIWVVEMRGYMQDAYARGEDQKSGRIVILEDDDNDGTMDRSKIFLDSLIMPRAITMVNGGILYAEPPNLWYVENIDDKPGKKQLIDSAYAIGGNAEHQPNGLMRGIDNWYYNAKSKARYKFVDNKWIKQETEFRGQWGITKDNYGRLFYNTNSNQLRGDLVPPNMLNRNPHLSARHGINIRVVENQAVFPIRPTPGVNRGYKEEILDDSMKLRNFTAACSPLIYRGNDFPIDYSGNAFVCEPAANLIKRNILTQNGVSVEGKQAYPASEFLASKDERFRPVSLNNGPDGSLYVVDMYRGIIQHKIFLTEFLRDQIMDRGLEKPIGMGRIYRIVYNKSWFSQLTDGFFSTEPSLHQASDKELVSYLSHTNGWWRDNAQRLLIERNAQSIIPDLIEILSDETSPGYAKIHALWTLEGMDIHKTSIIKAAIQNKDPEVVATAVRLAGQNSGRYGADMLEILELVATSEAPLVQLHLALSLGAYVTIDTAKTLEMLRSIAMKYGDDPLMQEAIVSSIANRELQLLELLDSSSPGGSALIEFLHEIVRKQNLKKELKGKTLTPAEAEQYTAGKVLYTKTCAACHNEDGNGLVPVAPPLSGSEWVTGSEKRLILIALHGLKGPIMVNGKVYTVPEVQPIMPGLHENPDFTDEKIAALLTYIRNAWSNEASAIEAATVLTHRKQYMDRTEPFTAKELIKQ